MKLCICNQHWGTHEICNNIEDLTPGSSDSWFMRLGVTGQNGNVNAKSDVGLFLLELVAVFQLCFMCGVWGFAMMCHRLCSSSSPFSNSLMCAGSQIVVVFFFFFSMHHLYCQCCFFCSLGCPQNHRWYPVVSLTLTFCNSNCLFLPLLILK